MGGRKGDLPPRGAGIIAVAHVQGKDYVLLTRNLKGVPSYPKGGRDKGESIRDNAVREWIEETGLDPEKLEFSGGWVDETHTGCRYLGAKWPGKGARIVTGATWAPPAEDPHDDNPVVELGWVPLEALPFQEGMKQARAELAKRVVEEQQREARYL